MARKKYSLEYRKQMSERCKRLGIKPPQRPKNRINLTCPTCGQIFETTKSNYRNGRKYCSKKCSDSCPIRKKRMGESQRKRMGSRAAGWKGGLTSLSESIRTCFEYRQWRSDVYTRDDFTCRCCGIRGGYLHAHHIKQLSRIVKENNIKDVGDYKDCEELWNINNGLTLCKNCHQHNRWRD